MPDMMKFLPGPPDSTSVAFMNDVAHITGARRCARTQSVPPRPPVTPCMGWKPKKSMETLMVSKGSKEEMYAVLYPQIVSVVEDETDMIANMANIAAMLHETFNFWWTGFYRVDGDELILGPFQGPLACTRIRKGRGVCGTAWQEDAVQLVSDVNQFPGHIACSSESKSEIVVPVHGSAGNVIAVLDIDSQYLDNFDRTDREWLMKIVGCL